MCKELVISCDEDYKRPACYKIGVRKWDATVQSGIQDSNLCNEAFVSGGSNLYIKTVNMF